MAKFYSQQKKRKSRLTKIEEKKSIKQAVLFGVLTILLIFILISIGIPALVKMITFLGDINSSGQKIETVNVLSPNIPKLQSLLEATNSGQIDISGFAEKEITIQLIVNQVNVKEITADENGFFIFNNVKLKLGENQIRAKAVDTVGNESKLSSELSILFDNQPPELEIVSPKNKDKFFDKNKQIAVKGKTEADIVISANQRLSVTDSQGNFSIILELKEGENEIRVKAKDKAGNETTKQITVTYIH